MENQELFDKYIKGLLSELEKTEFESRLMNDNALTSEFKTYLFTVKGIQNEEAQDCADFGTTMKKLTKEQLQEIVGVKAKPKQKNVLKFSPWLWSSISAAAVIAIVVTISFRFISNKDAQIVDYVLATNDIPTISKGVDATIGYSIRDLSEDDVKNILPEFEHLYKSSTDDQTIQINGFNLALVYIKLGEKQNAIDVLNELIYRYSSSEDFYDQEQVNKWRNIVKLIK